MSIGTLRTPDGLLLAVETWAGSAAPRLLMAHATSFCKEVWNPVASELRNRGFDSPIVAWDFRGHGDSDQPALPMTWWHISQDVVGVAAAQPDGARLVGMGHSMGAATTVMAELTRPGTFEALILIEPITLPGPYGRRGRDHPFIEKAARRKHRFVSREAVHAYLLERRSFSRWDPRALEAYVNHGFQTGPDGVVSKCEPAVEMEILSESLAHGVYERLGEVDPPVLMLVGGESETFPGQVAKDVVSRFRRAELVTLAGAGHLVPMERPGDVAEAALSWLRSR